MLKPFTNQSPCLPQDPGWDDGFGFGYRELDAFWLARWTQESGWEAGRLYEQQGASLELSLAANVLHYGQAIFEGLKAHRTREDKIVLFRAIDNARRMRASAARLVMPPLPVDDFVTAVHSVVRANHKWVPGYQKGSFYLRPVMIGTGQVLGVAPAQEYLFYVFGCPAGQYMGGSRVIVLSAAHRAAPYGTGAAKTAGNYAGCLRPQKIAKEMGYVDALYLDARDDFYIEELSGANFFAILHDGTLVTPELGSILPGITRDSVLTVARELFGWLTVERRLSIEEVLSDAVEAFYVGTAAVLSPVTTINYRGIDYPIADGEPGPRAERLLQALTAIRLQEQPDHWDWVKEITI
ncbi:MAG: branched-chain amino acid aminotransferase [Anaerolineae bacterium]|nr:branched-chain amino acid aminotransferase [Anaerolineae bacterium]